MDSVELQCNNSVSEDATENIKELFKNIGL